MYNIHDISTIYKYYKSARACNQRLKLISFILCIIFIGLGLYILIYNMTYCQSYKVIRLKPMFREVETILKMISFYK